MEAFGYGWKEEEEENDDEEKRGGITRTINIADAAAMGEERDS